MSKPVAGSPYTIVKGDTLTGIAKQAYGVGSRWRDIWAANKNSLKSGDYNLIYPGEVITIPKIPELQPVAGDDILQGDTRDDMSIVVDGKKIYVESARVIRTIDTPADGWTAEILWAPEDDRLSEITDLLRPYKYKEARAYVGGRLMVTGYLYAHEAVITPDRSSMVLQGFSKTVDFIDSNIGVQKEFKNVTLKEIATELIQKPHSVNVNFEATTDGKFDRVKANPTDKIGAFLINLAKQRSILMSSTERGEVVFFNANESGKPVITVGEGSALTQSFRTKWDGRQRFFAYKARCQRRGTASKIAKATDDVVPRTRVKTFDADDTTSGDIQAAADWERSKAVSDALSFPIELDGWHDPQGEIFKENTYVAVQSDKLFLPNGFTFLVKKCEYVYENKGRKTVLTLVPPTVYTGGDLVDPWA
jgi:prophage tail gpP-like protein